MAWPDRMREKSYRQNTDKLMNAIYNRLSESSDMVEYLEKTSQSIWIHICKYFLLLFIYIV